jgi:peptidoglycan biosynthesis protein MviN/MurJ (putative lipid II flippase)
MVKFAGLGHAGLALSTSTVALFGFVVLLIVMSRRIHGIHGAELWNSFWKICAASAVMAAACYASSHSLHAYLGNRVRVHLIDVIVSIPLGGIVFYAVAHWLRIAELNAARQAIAGPLARRFKFLGK